MANESLTATDLANQMIINAAAYGRGKVCDPLLSAQDGSAAINALEIMVQAYDGLKRVMGGTTGRPLPSPAYTAMNDASAEARHYLRMLQSAYGPKAG